MTAIDPKQTLLFHFSTQEKNEKSEIRVDSDRLTRWLTFGANLGVIVGIVFLVLEMRQNSAIASAQVRLDYAAGWRSVDESRQSESFAKVIVKSIESPEELSLIELVQLDAYYSGVLDQLLSAQIASTSGLRETPFADVAKSVGTIYFSNEFARSWWAQIRSDWSSATENGFQEIMDEAVVTGEIGRARRIYEGIQNNLSQQPGSSSN